MSLLCGAGSAIVSRYSGTDTMGNSDVKSFTLIIISGVLAVYGIIVSVVWISKLSNLSADSIMTHEGYRNLSSGLSAGFACQAIDMGMSLFFKELNLLVGQPRGDTISHGAAEAVAPVNFVYRCLRFAPIFISGVLAMYGIIVSVLLALKFTGDDNKWMTQKEGYRNLLVVFAGQVIGVGVAFFVKELNHLQVVGRPRLGIISIGAAAVAAAGNFVYLCLCFAPIFILEVLAIYGIIVFANLALKFTYDDNKSMTQEEGYRNMSAGLTVGFACLASGLGMPTFIKEIKLRRYNRAGTVTPALHPSKAEALLKGQQQGDCTWQISDGNPDAPTRPNPINFIYLCFCLCLEFIGFCGLMLALPS